jgi:hypothetical protein
LIAIPNASRKFYFNGSQYVGFKITPSGILLVPLEVKEKDPILRKNGKKSKSWHPIKGKPINPQRTLRSILMRYDYLGI